MGLVDENTLETVKQYNMISKTQKFFLRVLDKIGKNDRGSFFV